MMWTLPPLSLRSLPTHPLSHVCLIPRITGKISLTGVPCNDIVTGQDKAGF
jgi:hypothetical protein